MKTIKIIIKGMHCPSCEMLIKDIILDEKGVKNADVSLKNNSATIEYDEDIISVEFIKGLIKKEGYDVE